MNAVSLFRAHHVTIDHGFEMPMMDNFEMRPENGHWQLDPDSSLKMRRTCVMFMAALASIGMAAPSYATTTITQFTYDAGDHVASVTDPRGLVTTYAYDGLGHLWQQVSPDTGTTTFGYDAYGRRSSMTRADNTQTTYGLDALGRTTSVSAGGQSQTFTYDSCTNGVGRLCSLADATGTTSYSYSPEGWLTGRGFSVGGTNYALGYGYNAEGQIASVVYPDGNKAIYNYTQGVVSSMTLNVGGANVTGASGITYQPMNAGMNGWTSSNGLVNTLSYDTDGRLTGVGAGSVMSLGLSYDKADRIIGISNAIDGSMSQNFGYDDESRLVSAYSPSDLESYQYDANGNRTSQTVNGAHAVFTISTTSNRLTGVSGAATATYVYDAQGNTTTVNGATAYGFDAFNRLNTAGTATDYVNPEGVRLRKVSGAGTTYFAPQDGSLMAENDSGAWIDYVWLNGRLVGRISGSAVDAVHDDQVGRPQVVTDPSGTVVWLATNYPFEREVALDNISGLNLGFPGQYFDAERGVWNNGFRDYNSNLGRYIESDPLGQVAGVNTYAYARSRPSSLIDPMGLSPGDRDWRIICFVYFLACNARPNYMNQPPPEPPGYSAPSEVPGDIFKVKGLKKPSLPKQPPESCPRSGPPDANPFSTPPEEAPPVAAPVPVIPAVPPSVPWFFILPPGFRAIMENPPQTGPSSA